MRRRDRRRWSRRSATAQGAAGAPEDGNYLCRIQEEGYEYPAFRCVVRTNGGRTVLEKVDGTVRFRGVVAATAGGFAFTGEVFCPFGDCTEPVRAEFRGSSDGMWVAAFNARRAGPAMTVTLEPLLGDGGGSGYGGDQYGGYGYGGVISP